MKFLDVKTDFAFKKVFGGDHSKDILISFLNAAIMFDRNKKIEDLAVVDPYQIPLLKGFKDTYVDVKAVLSDKTKVIIEMQVLNYEGFEKRVLYNAAKTYSMQLKKGEDYDLLNPIIALTITDFTMFKDIKELITNFKLLDKKNLVEYSDDIELIFIELPKFNKEENELKDIQDKWIYFLKNAGTLDFIPETLKTEPEINEAFEIANEANLSEEELEIQHKRKDFLFIQKGSIEYAKKKGIENGERIGREIGLKIGREKGEKIGREKGERIGREEGKKIGRENGRKEGETKKTTEFVIKSYEIGIDIKTIAQIAGISVEEVKRIVSDKPTQ